MKHSLENTSRSGNLNKTSGKSEQTYLPTGDVIVLQDEKFFAPEILFHPHVIDVKGPSLHELIVKTIDGCEEEIRSQLYQNIVLSGGSSLFPGLEERLHAEIQSLRPHNKITIIAHPKRRFSSWVGGSMISPQQYKNKCIQKKEYMKSGSSILNTGRS